MSLLLVIMAALCTLAVMAALAGGDGRDTDGPSLIRLLAGPRDPIDKDPLGQIGDPMLAATAMMCAVAGGGVDAVKREIQAQMCWHFRIDGETAEEIYAAALPLAGGPGDLTGFLPRLRGPIVACCNLRERENLIRMLTAVAEASGTPSDAQARAIDRLRPYLGLSRG